MAGGAYAAESPPPLPLPPLPPVKMPIAPSAQSVVLQKVVIDLPAGEALATLQTGLWCITFKSVTWPGGLKELTVPGFVEIFHDEMIKAGYTVPGGSQNLFDTASATASEYAMAARITHEHYQTCTNGITGKGQVVMSIEWQLYSRLQARVVATIPTSATFETSKSDNVLLSLDNGVFTRNIEQLAASPELRKALSAAPATPDNGVLAPTEVGTRIVLAPRPPGVSKPSMDEQLGSVVQISNGVSVGSGALISSDGYVLTAAHVVGDAKKVRVRWSDGLETVGEVIRSSKARDVALIKTDDRGRTPLPLRRNPMQVGETVLAIGTPFSNQFQNTVTRGVVSGNRVIDGFSYVQSDASVAAGSSGGPLLDDSGRVVGFTASQVRIGGVAPVGIGLFVPARDAADFLGLDIR